MIKNKNDYYEFLEKDRISLGKIYNIKDYIFDDIWKFQRLLRKTEFMYNCKKGFIFRIINRIYYFRMKKFGRKLGFDIPINVFGPGLSIAHPGTIVVNHNATIGANCRIHVCVNIGASNGESFAPKIGDNCYIGPGAKIFGNIKIGNNVAIGANAVVNKSFGDDITIAGVPAKKISDKGTLKM